MDRWKARWREMDLFRRGLLLVLAAAIPLFALLTAVQYARPGIWYGDSLLRRIEAENAVQYAGKCDGAKCAFTVESGGVVTYRWGDYAYGPYTVKEAPDALPEQSSGGYPLRDYVGVEVWQEEKLLFRGGWYTDEFYSYFSLVDEKGERVSSSRVYATTGDGTIIMGDGTVITQRDMHEPDVSDLLRVALSPVLVHQGSWWIYALLTLLALACGGYIVFYRELFQWDLRFMIRNTENAQPSDWYLFRTYAAMGIWTLVVVVLYAVQAFSVA